MRPPRCPLLPPNAGFRKYRNILQTLCHELTHNIHSAHDSAFKVGRSG